MKMLGNRPIAPIVAQECPLYISWHDTQMMATLSPATVMDYFCRKSNPFYDRVCNNETIRMQRLSPDHLNNMVGVEFVLLHVSEPILYVIRKQHRHSPTEATPIADYYIIGGMVYKAPDLASVINSRVLATVTNLQAAFEETSQYMRYAPSKGYTWDFSSNKALSDKSKNASKKDVLTTKEEPTSVFQMHRIEILFNELLRSFPPPPAAQANLLPQLPMQVDNAMGATPSAAGATPSATTNGGGSTDGNINNNNNGVASPSNMDPMDMKPPAEKKSKLN